jgi:exopolysaccharide production protein ExoZ
MRANRNHPFAERLANVYELGGEATTRNLPMEGLRGFAVLLVFFVHYHALFGAWVSSNSMTFAFSKFLSNVGQAGVDLFFVLSGYLIYGSVIKKHRSYFGFIGRRIQRIYPTFLCVFAIYVLLSVLFPSESKVPTNAMGASLFLLENALLLPGLFNIPAIVTVAWSLSYEFFYYLLIPVLVGILAMRYWNRSGRVIFFSAVAIGFTTYCVMGHPLHIRLIMFISGILLFEARHPGNMDRRLTLHSDVLVTLLLLVTFPMIYALTERAGLFSYWPGIVRFGEIYRICLLFTNFFVLVLASFSGLSLLSRVFSWTPIRWLGNISYSYYLIHGLTLKGIAFVMLRAIPPDGHRVIAFLVGFPLFFLLTFIAASVLFILVERRFSLLPGKSASTAAVPGREPKKPGHESDALEPQPQYGLLYDSDDGKPASTIQGELGLAHGASRGARDLPDRSMHEQAERNP